MFADRFALAYLSRMDARLFQGFQHVFRRYSGDIRPSLESLLLGVLKRIPYSEDTLSSVGISFVELTRTLEYAANRWEGSAVSRASCAHHFSPRTLNWLAASWIFASVDRRGRRLVWPDLLAGLVLCREQFDDAEYLPVLETMSWNRLRFEAELAELHASEPPLQDQVALLQCVYPTRMTVDALSAVVSLVGAADVPSVSGTLSVMGEVARDKLRKRPECHSAIDALRRQVNLLDRQLDRWASDSWMMRDSAEQLFISHLRTKRERLVLELAGLEATQDLCKMTQQALWHIDAFGDTTLPDAQACSVAHALEADLELLDPNAMVDYAVTAADTFAWYSPDDTCDERLPLLARQCVTLQEACSASA